MADLRTGDNLMKYIVRNIAGGLEGRFNSIEDYVRSEDYSDSFDVFGDGDAPLTEEEAEELRQCREARDEGAYD